MRLVVDASTIVAEVLRVRGRKLLAQPSLDLFVAEDAWSETEHELGKRVGLIVERGHLEPALAAQLLDEALALLAARVRILPTDAYVSQMDEARRRVPRDPRDAPTVALALALDCGIWTNDRDFFGCGLPVWVTDVLQAHLEAQAIG
jgi:predicted nucleic acid-binding protein